MKKLNHILNQVLYTNLGDKLWKITHINLKPNWGIVATFEAKKRHRLVCSKCEGSARHQCVGVRKHRALHQILSMGGIRLYVLVKQPLIRCAGCHQQSVCRPHWLKAGSRYTEPFRMFIAMLCRVMSCAAVADLYQMSSKTVRAIDADILKETTQHIDLSHTRRLMVDERWIAKNRFVTLVLDGDSHQLLYLGQGRRGETLRRFLYNLPL